MYHVRSCLKHSNRNRKIAAVAVAIDETAGPLTCATPEVLLMQEQQVLSLCLKHTLNNLLQEPHFSKEDLDRVAEQLAPGRFKLSNPHKKAFFGDYDVVSRWQLLSCTQTTYVALSPACTGVTMKERH